MPSKIRHGLLIIITVIGLFFTSLNATYAQTINYIYDDLNRLIRIVYDNGTVIQYTYDEVGNRLEERIELDTTPPTGTIVIDSGEGFTNSTTITLTLSCNDANGCSQMQFSNDNITYSTPELFASTKVWTLSPGSGVKTVYVKLRDAAGVWSNPFTDTIAACTSSSARIGGTSYATLQAAYNAAGDGSTIKTLGMRLIENLTVNRNINVALEGGYDCGYTTNIGGVTIIKGMVTITAGGGKLTIKNIIIGDATLPTGTITINLGAGYTNNTNVNLTLSCSNTNGCSQMQFSNDNVTYSAPEAYATTKAWTLTTGDATKTVYAKFKDAPGNWSSAFNDAILLDTTAPTTTVAPPGGTYSSAQSVTLSCTDGAGSGCDKIYYTTDGSTPTTSSPVYSTPINISVTTTLKFFAKDLAGNSEAVKAETYTINTGGGCSDPPVKIGSTFYSTLQSAYNAAVTGDIIKCQNVTFTENLTVNRNIAVTLEGGYDCEYTTNVEGQTTIKGMLTTTIGGGMLTIKNFILAN